MTIEWDWDDPAETDRISDGVMSDLARVGDVEELPLRPPFEASHLRNLGVIGIEFGVFESRHPFAVSSDIVALHSGTVWAQSRRLYRIDGRFLFIPGDIADPLPFGDRSVEWVYAEHLIEHVSLKTAIHWLGEVRRILKPGGVVRVTTPDLARYMDGYQRGSFLQDHREIVKSSFPILPSMPNRRAFMVNQIFAFYGHQWIYDYEELEFALMSAGFDAGRIHRREFQEGIRGDVARLDQSARRDETLYVEAQASRHR